MQNKIIVLILLTLISLFTALFTATIYVSCSKPNNPQPSNPVKPEISVYWSVSPSAVSYVTHNGKQIAQGVFFTLKQGDEVSYVFDGRGVEVIFRINQNSTIIHEAKGKFQVSNTFKY